MNTKTDSDARARLLDDLLWLHGRGNRDDGLREAVEAMIGDYTDDTNRYSDGSEVWKWYGEFPGATLPPKVSCTFRRTARSDKHIYVRSSRRVDGRAGRCRTR